MSDKMIISTLIFLSDIGYRCAANHRKRAKSQRRNLDYKQALKQPVDQAFLIDVNFMRRWRTRQSGHCHNVTAKRDDEPRPCRQTHIANRQLKSRRSTQQASIRRKAILRFGPPEKDVCEIEVEID